MRNKNFILLLSGTLLTLCASFNSASKVSPGAGVEVLSFSQEREDFTQADAWIRSLRAPDEEERETAKGKVIAFASGTPEARQYVIKELLKIANVPGGRAELERHASRIYEWKEAVDILGAIKATEAIDTLVACLDYNYGPAGLSPYRYPATMAVIEIGEESIPKLGAALQQQTSRGVRYRAAQALYGIGGDKAKHVLEKEAERNKDKQFVTIIKDLLRNWNESGKYKP